MASTSAPAKHPATRITDGWGDTVGYLYRGWTLRKEFYADGPSMFTWTITTPAGELNAGVHETNRLADAKKVVDTALDLTPLPVGTRFVISEGMTGAGLTGTVVDAYYDIGNVVRLDGNTIDTVLFRNAMTPLPDPDGGARA